MHAQSVVINVVMVTLVLLGFSKNNRYYFVFTLTDIKSVKLFINARFYGVNCRNINVSSKTKKNKYITFIILWYFKI